MTRHWYQIKYTLYQEWWFLQLVKHTFFNNDNIYTYIRLLFKLHHHIMNPYTFLHVSISKTLKKSLVCIYRTYWNKCLFNSFKNDSAFMIILLLKESVYATSIWCGVGMRYHGICLFTHKLMKNRCLTIFASSCSYTCQINCDKWTYFSGLKINSASNRRSSYKKLILCVSMWSTEIILRDL